MWADHGSGADDDVTVWRAVPNTILDLATNLASAVRHHGPMGYGARVVKNFAVYDAMGAFILYVINKIENHKLYTLK